MVKTRRARKSKSSARRSYRRRVRGSKCRGAGPAACRGRSGCKYASGRKRNFCRKTKNTRRRRRSRRSRRGGTLMSQVRRALVPYALFHAKRGHQRRRRKSRKRRRRRRRR